MNSDINLSVFPSNKLESLTMLYLRNQDLSNFTPSQIVEEYYKAYEEIKKTNKEIKSKNNNF